MSNSWVDQKKYLNNRHTHDIHKNKVEYLLDESYTKINSVPGLKTSLYEHQKTVVRAMLDLEMKRDFELFISPHGNILEKICNINVTAGILSESVGSGKTIDVLSLILLQKQPKVCVNISSLTLFKDTVNQYSNTRKVYLKNSCIVLE